MSEQTTAKAKPATSKKSAAKEAVAEIEATSRLDELKAKIEQARGNFEESSSKVAEDAKRFALAYAGVLGTAYDRVVELTENGKQSGNDKIDQFAARGEKLRDDAKAKVEELKLPKNLQDIKAKFEDLEIPTDLDAIKQKFDEVKAKVLPSKQAA